MNLTASIQDRLKSKSKQLNIPYATILEQFALGRFFARLVVSQYADQFILKGAQLFRFWSADIHRPTRDADFLGAAPHQPTELEEIFTKIFHTPPIEEDTLEWGKINAVTIRNDKTYGGVRITATALLGRIRIPLQFDVGYGDAITPSIIKKQWHSILDYSKSELLTYPPETVIAEKIEAATSLEINNSRMKDFFDLHWLSLHQSFQYSLLSEAVTNTFNRRKTKIPAGLPLAYTPEFANDASKQIQWKAFLRKSKLEIVPFEIIIKQLQQFVEPLFVRNDDLTEWSPESGWK